MPPLLMVALMPPLLMAVLMPPLLMVEVVKQMLIPHQMELLKMFVHPFLAYFLHP
jgi:hypothetical protein